MSVNEEPISLSDLRGLIAMDTRSIMTPGSGQTAAVSIPAVSSLPIDVDDEDLTAVVSVRKKDGEIIVTARISHDSEDN